MCENLRSQYKHLFQREEFAFVFTQFFLSLSSLPVPSFFWECSQDMFVFPAMFTAFYEKIGSLSMFFLFRRSIMFLTTKTLANQVCIHFFNTTHCSLIVFREPFLSLVSRSYHKLQKATGAIQKTYFPRKTHSFWPRNLGIVSIFHAELKFGCFILAVL